MRRTLSSVILFAVLATGLAVGAPAAVAGTDMDCGDFATQAAAQAFFLDAGAGDPHRLDADGDGRVCETNSGPVQRHWANVVRVSDGDTLLVRIQGVGVRSVRILGIDTPEVYGGSECGGDAASARMARLAPVGSRVRLESDPSQADRDRYGRWLRYVAREGLDVGREQVRRGLARTYVYRNDPFRRTGAYLRTEEVARDRLRGSWARCW